MPQTYLLHHNKIQPPKIYKLNHPTKHYFKLQPLNTLFPSPFTINTTQPHQPLPLPLLKFYNHL
ncbi:hypothetical protein [Staphylococcus epidermidis]|uniref:hypothetical protein n=1 Tax=Staphylococcus epidermidis TaxID=1282 RepID=UPI0037D9C5B9